MDSSSPIGSSRPVDHGKSILIILIYGLAYIRKKTGVVVQALKYVFMGLAMMGLLVLGSCAMIGYSAVTFAESAAPVGDKLLEELEAEAEKQEMQKINDQLDREIEADERRASMGLPDSSRY